MIETEHHFYITLKDGLIDNIGVFNKFGNGDQKNMIFQTFNKNGKGNFIESLLTLNCENKEDQFREADRSVCCRMCRILSRAINFLEFYFIDPSDPNFENEFLKEIYGILYYQKNIKKFEEDFSEFRIENLKVPDFYICSNGPFKLRCLQITELNIIEPFFNKNSNEELWLKSQKNIFDFSFLDKNQKPVPSNETDIMIRSLFLSFGGISISFYGRIYYRNGDILIIEKAKNEDYSVAHFDDTDVSSQFVALRNLEPTGFGADFFVNKIANITFKNSEKGINEKIPLEFLTKEKEFRKWLFNNYFKGDSTLVYSYYTEFK